MEIVKFSRIHSLDYNLRQLSICNQIWSENQLFSMWENIPRQTSALVYFKNCDAVFMPVNGETLHVKKGSLVYLPQGSRYKSRFYPCGTALPHARLIQFELFDNANNSFAASKDIIILHLPSTYNIDGVFEEIVTLYNKPVPSYSIIKSKIYALLHEICKGFHDERIYSKKYMPIAKGIAYLEQGHSYDLSVKEIAAMCHVSESCFRKLFQQYSGFSPIQYKTNSLLRQAKDMIRSGDATVNEIAARLGFNDVGYFSRWFKSHVGVSPSKFLNSPKDVG